MTGFTLERVPDMTRTYSQCTFNHLYSEAGVISNIFPLLKPKINNKCIQYEQTSNLKIKGYLLLMRAINGKSPKGHLNIWKGTD